MNQIKYISMISLLLSATAIAQEVRAPKMAEGEATSTKAQKTEQGLKDSKGQAKGFPAQKLEKTDQLSDHQGGEVSSDESGIVKSESTKNEVQSVNKGDQHTLLKGDVRFKNQGESGEHASGNPFSSGAVWKFALLLGLIALGVVKFGPNKKNPTKKAPNDHIKVDEKAEWFSRFERAQSDHISAYIAYYLIAMAEEADWNFEHIDILYERYGKQLSIPSIDPAVIVGSRSSIEAHKYLMEWLKSKGAENSSHLGIFDNIHPWMKQVAQKEAKALLEKLKEEFYA